MFNIYNKETQEFSFGTKHTPSFDTDDYVKSTYIVYERN